MLWTEDILVAIGSYSLSKSYQREHKQWDKPGNRVRKTTQYETFSDFLNGEGDGLSGFDSPRPHHN